jgi:hypothetical protein
MKIRPIKGHCHWCLASGLEGLEDPFRELNGCHSCHYIFCQYHAPDHDQLH